MSVTTVKYVDDGNNDISWNFTPTVMKVELTRIIVAKIDADALHKSCVKCVGDLKLELKDSTEIVETIWFQKRGTGVAQNNLSKAFGLTDEFGYTIIEADLDSFMKHPSLMVGGKGSSTEKFVSLVLHCVGVTLCGASMSLPTATKRGDADCDTYGLLSYQGALVDTRVYRCMRQGLVDADTGNIEKGPGGPRRD